MLANIIKTWLTFSTSKQRNKTWSLFVRVWATRYSRSVCLESMILYRFYSWPIDNSLPNIDLGSYQYSYPCLGFVYFRLSYV